MYLKIPEILTAMTAGDMDMKDRVPKTGLAKRMRAWMKGRKRPFGISEIYSGLLLPAGKERAKAANAMPDFLNRGEIVRVSDKQNRRQPAQKYRYNHAWQSGHKAGQIEGKICKAMRLISFHEPFAVSDIQRLTGLTERNYIDKLTRRLLADGHLKREGSRSRATSYGKETLYRVVNADRFRVEVMR